jgi:restriction endonuclease Mrr
VPQQIIDEVRRLRNDDGKELTKRGQMDALYVRLREGEYNRRLEVSRNFARILIEQESFTAQDSKHQVQKAQFAALRLRELLSKQVKDQEAKESTRRAAAKAVEETYDVKLSRLRDRFFAAHNLSAQEKGYELERIFTDLMRISGIQVEEPFRIAGEQFDGAIKYEGRYYLIELKWTTAKTEAGEPFKFYGKVLGKMDGRGIFISMSGFTSGVLESLPHGKDLKIFLLDGIHLTNVLTGSYTFRDLLDHAIKSMSLKGDVYCSHSLS